MITIKGLFIHPIKSCRRISVPSFEVKEYGPELDRELLIIDAATGRFIEGEPRRRLTTVGISLINDSLSISRHGARLISLKLNGLGTHEKWCKPRIVSVYDKEQEAFDQGDPIAEWFSAIVGTPCRVMQTHPRSMPKKVLSETKTMTVAGHDSSPFHLVNEHSLGHLNRMATLGLEDGDAYNPAAVERFRPNILIGGSLDAYDEEKWNHVRIGPEVVLEVRKRTPRCAMIQVNPETGEFRHGLLKILSGFKLGKDGPEFGIYLYPLQTGTIKVGDAVVPE